MHHYLDGRDPEYDGGSVGVRDSEVFPGAFAAAYALPVTTPAYSIGGFEPPFDNITTIKGKNRCVPLRTELLDADGLPITDADISHPPILILEGFSSAIAPSDTTVFDGLPPSEATDGIHFVFNGHLWCFNLKIKDYYSDFGPGFYTFMMKSGDESEYLIDSEFAEVTFAVRK
jgi:hypothetical protein